MSAQESTSELSIKEIDGKQEKFRTITTHENGDIKKTSIQQAVSEEDYNKLSDDLKGGSSDGLFFQVIRNDIRTRNSDGEIDYINSYTKAASRSVQRQMNDPKTYFKRSLDEGSIKAILGSDNKFSLGEKTLYRRDFALQYPSLINVENDTLGDRYEDGIERIDFPVGENFKADRLDFALEEIKIEGKRQKKYENLFYPETINTLKQDRITFQMFYQSGRTVDFNLNDPNGNIFSFGSRNKKTIEGIVTLPIQGNIQDRNEVSYQGSKLNPVMGSLAAVSMDPMGALRQVGNVLNMSADQIRSELNTTATTNVINALRVYLAQTATGTQGLIPRTTGAILNPNLELLLSAPNLRSFQFSFKMSARSRTEAMQIKKIIRFFKQGMSVKRSPTSLFIVSPNMFKIKYLTDAGMEHPSIGRIKDCALTSLNTQYTPDGTYMTFDDEARTMTSYQIDMTFTELEPITEDDYGNSEDLEGAENFMLLPTIEEEIGRIPDNHIGY